MPLDKTKIDINRGTTGLIPLPPEISGEIWQNAIEGSAVMQLARQIKLPASGVSVPIITGDPTAEWVGETEEKPVSKPTFGSKIIKPYKMAVIEMFSNEYRRSYGALYEQLIARLPFALARKFDATVLGTASKPGDNFDQLTDLKEIDIQKDAWAGLVQARTEIALNNGVLNGFAIAPQAEGILLTQTDKNGRPLFVDVASGEVGTTRLVGAPAFITRGVYIDGASAKANTVGFGGDWTNAVWGSVEGIQFKVSDQATINDGTRQVNLFQRNMFAAMVEFEVGFVVDDKKKFVRLTDTKKA